MITLSYMTLCRNQTFAMAMQKMISTPCNQKLSYQIMKISDALKRAQKAIDQEYGKEIVHKFGKKDEKGNLVIKTGTHDQFETADGQEEAIAKAQDEFWEKIYKIDRSPIQLEHLSEIKLSAQELGVLQPVWHELSSVGSAELPA